MKSAFFLVLIAFVFIGAGCGPAVLQTATPPATAPALSPAPTAVPTRAPLSFVPETYQDKAAGFEFDYPIDWTLMVSPVGSRGAQIQLFSPGTTADSISDTGSRVSITVVSWDPKNDLAAFAIQHKTAWGTSGSSIVHESRGDLLDGRKQMSFVVQSADKVQAFFLLTTLGDQYLQIAGEGNLTLAEEIAHTVRPLDFPQ